MSMLKEYKNPHLFSIGKKVLKTYQLKLASTSETFSWIGKIIFLRHENIFEGLEKNLKEREKFNFVRKDLVN